MKVELTIENDWVEEGINGKIVRRIQTFEEFIEYQCQICYEEEADIELDFVDDTYLLICRGCGKLFFNGILNNKNFYDNITMTVI